jgi:hypothetical protein
MGEIRPVDLARVFLDAFEAEASRRTGTEWRWIGSQHDPALFAGVEAVRDAIAEHHKAQWSELVDQGCEVGITQDVGAVLADRIRATVALADYLGVPASRLGVANVDNA